MAVTPVRVALLRPDPALAARLAAVPGVVVVTVVVADGWLPGGPAGGVGAVERRSGGAGPESANPLPPGRSGDTPGDAMQPAPMLVLAEGAAAVAALRAGARAVLPREAPAAEFAAALAAVANGLAVLPAATLVALTGREGSQAQPTGGAGGGAASGMGGGAPAPGLTRREREVLDLLAAGASNKVIVRRLGLSFHTAKAHVAAVLLKLGAGSRADAVARGARAGLVLL